jgi:alanyl-tRNA synthetase
MSILPELVYQVKEIYQDTDYFSDEEIKNIKVIITAELDKFRNTLAKGLREIDKIEKIDAEKAFNLYQSYGFPAELTAELFAEKGQELDLEEFKKVLEHHQELSRDKSADKFSV